MEWQASPRWVSDSVEKQIDSAWLDSSAGQRTSIEGSCSFGRAPFNSVVITNDKVSRRHAVINVQNEVEFWLIDLGSSNGTYLNGRRMVQPCRLADADQIEIGGYSFTFRNPKSKDSVQGEPSTEKTIHDIKSIQCWLLVADIESSTQFTQTLPPDQAARMTGRWLGDCKQIVEGNGGVINKFLGDGFFAYWSQGETAADSVVSALRALKTLQLQPAPRFRVVTHYGQVFVGGEGSMGEESLLGNEVNFVFRMEKLAASMGASCLMSDKACHMLGQRLDYTECHSRPLPSFDGEFVFHCF